MDLKQLFAQVTDDHVIDTAEVEIMKTALYEDGQIDRDEMDFIFDVNDDVTGNENCAEWTPFAAKVIADGVLADDTTPGVVDEEEAAYLIEKMGADGQVDETEKAALRLIKERATEIHPTLEAYIEQHVN